MKNLYKKIKQTARKYTLLSIVAGSMALGSCSNNENYSLLIDKEIARNNLEVFSNGNNCSGSFEGFLISKAFIEPFLRKEKGGQ